MKDTREFQTIKVEVEDALGRLTLNRPERLNAVGATMLEEMAEAARWFDSHRELRVVIVSGAGRAFCAGADLKDSPAAAAARLDNSWLYRREVGQYGPGRKRSVSCRAPSMGRGIKRVRPVG